MLYVTQKQPKSVSTVLLSSNYQESVSHENLNGPSTIKLVGTASR